MMQKPGPDGAPLHGSGTARSEAWWKGLAGLLVGKGMVELKSMQVRGGLGGRGQFCHDSRRRAGVCAPSEVGRRCLLSLPL
jgi:hypothetical protein